MFSVLRGIFRMISHTSWRNSTKENKACIHGIIQASMEPWKAHQKKACKAQGVWFLCFMVLARSFSMLPAKKQQSMSGAKALLRYTAVTNIGEMQQIAIILEGSLRGSGKKNHKMANSNSNVGCT